MQTEPTVATVIAAPWGPIHVAATNRGVVAVEVETTADAFEGRLVRRGRGPVAWLDPERSPAPPIVAAAAAAIEAAVAGDPAAQARLDALPLDLGDRPPFDREVLVAVRAIPRGETRSYAEIARAVGRPGAARAVGGAVGRNPVGLLVPCHRVVAADGTLGGYGGGWWGDRERNLERKAELLATEGVALPRTVPGRRSRALRGR